MEGKNEEKKFEKHFKKTEGEAREEKGGETKIRSAENEKRETMKRGIIRRKVEKKGTGRR
jgi:hypothetical protein